MPACTRVRRLSTPKPSMGSVGFAAPKRGSLVRIGGLIIAVLCAATPWVDSQGPKRSPNCVANEMGVLDDIDLCISARQPVYLVGPFPHHVQRHLTEVRQCSDRPWLGSLPGVYDPQGLFI